MAISSIPGTVLSAPVASSVVNASTSTGSGAALSGSPPSVAADVWSSAAVTQALQTLNDTTGKVAASDQLSAYNLIADLWSGGPTGSGAPGGADRISFINSFTNTAFSKQVQAAEVSYSNASATPHGTSDVAAQQQQVDAFSGLSLNDQTIVVNQLNNASVNGQFGNGNVAFASVDSYKANLTVRLGSITAVQNAVTSGAYKLGQDISTISDPNLAGLLKLSQVQIQNNDAWTTKAQAALNALSTDGNGGTPNAPAVKVTLSSVAQATLSSKITAATSSNVALQLLTSANTSSVGGAKHTSTVATREAGAKTAQPAYTQGSIYNTTV